MQCNLPEAISVFLVTQKKEARSLEMPFVIFLVVSPSPSLFENVTNLIH